jgi:hypothetical protein
MCLCVDDKELNMLRKQAANLSVKRRVYHVMLGIKRGQPSETPFHN